MLRFLVVAMLLHSAFIARPCINAQDVAADNLQWGEAKEGFRLSIEVNKRAHSQMDPIEILIRRQNVSPEATKLVLARPVQDCQFDVTLPKGGPAPLTLYGKEIGKGGASNAFVFSFGPGEIHEQPPLVLNAVYDMTIPGEYKVVARKRIRLQSAPDDEISVESNVLVIVVLPR